MALYPGSKCNICERPAVGHWGCGPRCGLHQYDERETLDELRAKRARIDAQIAERTRHLTNPERW